MTATLTFDYALFIAQCPAFSNPVIYPQASLQIQWDIATIYISDVANFGSLQFGDRQYAINLMIAHLLTLMQQSANGQVPGLMENATIDKVSVGLTPPPVPTQFRWWLNLTPYGQMLSALLQVRSSGGFYVGGGAPLVNLGYGGIQ